MQESGSGACPHRDGRSEGLSRVWGMFPAQLPPSFSEERREGQGKLSLALSCATTLERWTARTTLRVSSAHQPQVLVALSQFWHLQSACAGWLSLYWCSHFLLG